MQIRHLKIERFRGIRELEWRPDSGVVCLVGPNDSRKTTILDAIECALTSRWALPITDADFCGLSPTEPIGIEVTIGDLPDSLKDEQKYGLELRGWNGTEGLKDEPGDGDEDVLTLRFSVDDSMEPRWLVVNDRRPEGRAISSRDREVFGLMRLGVESDRHLSWGRGSALSRNTEDIEGVGRVLAEAHRQARDVVAKTTLPKLEEAATRAKEAAVQMGVRVLGQYRPALDAALGAGGVGALTLHEDAIPVRVSGLGTRRLAALGLQARIVAKGALLLVDEVEHGLEPHRLRHLLRILRTFPSEGRGQVLMTTHSPVVITELEAEDVQIVRCSGGSIRVKRIPGQLQALVRGSAETLLGRKALVCEGKTEIGVCRGLEGVWAQAHGGRPLTHTGTVLTDGGGQRVSGTAINLAGLGYATAVLADSDHPDGPDAVALKNGGVQEVFLWDGGVSIEERIALDLPWTSLQEVLDLAVSFWGVDSVVDTVRSMLNTEAVKGTKIDKWKANGLEELSIRSGIGKAAKKKHWFALIEYGQALGQIVARVLPEIAMTDLGMKLEAAAAWAYAE